MIQSIAKSLNQIKKFAETELQNILHYWIRNAIDIENGGFVGRINGEEEIIPGAIKGSVLNARLLWTFSSAYSFRPEQVYLEMAERSFDYLQKYFIDPVYGGTFWAINASGEPKDTRKQVYSMAFAIYGLAAYYKTSNRLEAKNLAIRLFHDIEANSRDRRHNGYFEAFNQDWSLIQDMRLSEKDQNECKTMNTHLHILEAYTELYKIWPNIELKNSLTTLLNVFDCFIIDNESGHLNLFFNEYWELRSDSVSYGHDIEASWLLLEAAKALGNKEEIKKFEEFAVLIANASITGIDETGGMSYEMEHGKYVKEKHWWVQAEALVGLINAFQVTKNKYYLELTNRVVCFTQKNIVDHNNGEWFWGVDEDLQVMKNEDKVGFWKCPYHNTRACLELLLRVNRMIEEEN